MGAVTNLMHRKRGGAMSPRYLFEAKRGRMARKPNYGQNRADVNRAKQARKEAKLEAQQAAVARRKTGEELPEGETAPQPPRKD